MDVSCRGDGSPWALQRQEWLSELIWHHSPCFAQRFSLTSFPSLLVSNFIQLSRYLLIFLTTTLRFCFLRKREVFSTSRKPSWSWQVHRGAWAQGVETAGRKGPLEELEMPRHDPDLMWRSFPSSVDSHCWFWLVPLHELITTFWFIERHCCLRTWTIWNPSGRWETYEVPWKGHYVASKTTCPHNELN